MRRLGLADRAAGDLARAGDDERELLAAYARGVNEGVGSLRTLPPEFALLGETPEPWRPEHSLLLGRMLLFSFATNWDTELAAGAPVARARARARRRGGLRLPRGGGHRGHPPADHRRRPAVGRLPGGAGGRALPTGAASNAWAAAGSRTASGAPLLASDPHLQAQLPGLFHVSHLRGGALDVAGAGIPGLPGIAIGHNGAIAWGLTAGLADVSDCYIETVDAREQPARYLTPEGWVSGRHARRAHRRPRRRDGGGARAGDPPRPDHRPRAAGRGTGGGAALDHAGGGRPGAGVPGPDARCRRGGVRAGAGQLAGRLVQRRVGRAQRRHRLPPGRPRAATRAGAGVAAPGRRPLVRPAGAAARAVAAEAGRPAGRRRSVRQQRPRQRRRARRGVVRAVARRAYPRAAG